MNTLGQSDLCKNIEKTGSLPCPFKGTLLCDNGRRGGVQVACTHLEIHVGYAAHDETIYDTQAKAA
jgi:hypothetical protein